MFVCHYERKKFVDDHRQKYAEITKICLGNEITNKRLQFLQTKHLQCSLPLGICPEETVPARSPSWVHLRMSASRVCSKFQSVHCMELDYQKKTEKIPKWFMILEWFRGNVISQLALTLRTMINSSNES